MSRMLLELADDTDALNRRATVRSDMGEVLQIAGHAAMMQSAFERSIELFEEKGNVLSAARVRALMDDPALV